MRRLHRAWILSHAKYSWESTYRWVILKTSKGYLSKDKRKRKRCPKQHQATLQMFMATIPTRFWSRSTKRHVLRTVELFLSLRHFGYVGYVPLETWEWVWPWLIELPEGRRHSHAVPRLWRHWKWQDSAAVEVRDWWHLASEVVSS